LPVSGQPISRQTTSDIVDKILALPPKTRVVLLAPVVVKQKGEFRDVIERLAREGFVRARVDGEAVELSNNVRVKLDPKQRHTIEAVVDRLVIDDKVRIRLSDSVETALKWGDGRLALLQQSGETPPGAICGRSRCIPIAITVRPPARVLIRRRRNIFPSTRRWGPVPFATAWGRNWFSTSI
jgi:excinuclease UvrABC ATPase subunit